MPAENYEEISFSPQTGWSRRGGIIGPKAGVKAMMSQLAAQNLNFTYRCDQSPNATIVFETPGNPEGGGGGTTELPTTIWEYFANQLEIDILEADLDGTVSTVNLNDISASEKKLLRDRINGQDVAYPDPFSTAFDTIYKLIEGGVRSVRVTVPTLRVSRQLATFSAVYASISNSGRIFSATTINSENSDQPYDLPPSATVTKDGVNFIYGWFKKFPSSQQVGGNKFNISQEWEYGLWPVATHGALL